ncbi:hypothetical protein KAU33_15425 [Candidatus Dependentiae bacterium]|nr:hypothetical protein [Candidatus Dependentiae bacterium]
MTKRKLKIHDMVLAENYYFARLGRVIDKIRATDQKGISDPAKYLVQFDSDIHYKEDVRSIPRNELTYVPVTKRFSGRRYEFWDVHSLNDAEEMLAYREMTYPRLKSMYDSVRTVSVDNVLLVYVSTKGMMK